MRLPNPFRKKEYKFLTPVAKSDDSILERPEFLPEEERVRRSKQRRPKKKGKQNQQLSSLISYLKKPHSETGLTALCGGVVAMLFTVLAFFSMIQAAGEPSLTVSAAVMSAMLVSIYGIYLAVTALREKEKNQLYTWIGLSLCGLVLVTWLIAQFLGLSS
ncbi:hypothetical protein [Stomatobaculum longum]|uniref:hypothetical protein n=1 Tax=Stomatobaculum longum TaxID=796942 RepID=UPI003C706DB4